MFFPLSSAIALVLLLCGPGVLAQTVQPLIVEFKAKAQGKFALTNNTLMPLAVVLEPKSFSITAEGTGQYRALDPGIHLQLSSMSFRLGPKETHYVFYKATGDKLPAWFTVYSVFTPLQPRPGLDVRLLLRGRVLDTRGQPVGGAAVMIDKLLV